ncbi:MAG: polyprenyl synthetase family protein [Planctomycetota bacterium]|jgi:octaprenyl-diphosphate synthase
MDFSEMLKPVYPSMVEIEKRLYTDLAAKNKDVGEIILHVSRFKGKRFRPAVLLLSGKACGKVVPQHIDLAVVAELIHIATLIHDDIIDDATMRRHVESVNMKWGREISILLGDYIWSRGFTILASMDSQIATYIMSQTVNIMCEGELIQLLRRYDLNLTEEEYLDILERKTAKLFATSCRLGAMFAGANRKMQEAVTGYGMKVGMAFQIVDDCLDIIGSEEEMGKSLTSDIKKGKLTLPIIHLAGNLPEARRESTCNWIFQNFSEQTRGEVLELLTEHDAVEYSMNRARKYVEDAKEDIAPLPESESKTAMLDLADSVISRKK